MRHAVNDAASIENELGQVWEEMAGLCSVALRAHADSSLMHPATE
jgi:hypothetical protein